MAEVFESIVFEASTDGITWVDFTADVLANPAPKGSRGILGNNYSDRLPDGNTLTFSLNNSSKNSQATQAYYSSNNARVYVTSEIRVGFQYDGRMMYKWRGYVQPDGWVATAGTKGPRRVDVTCRDWFSLMGEFDLDSIEYQANKRIEEAVALILAELTDQLRPYYTRFATGDETFADVFDVMKSETKVLGELNKLVISEFGMIYERGNSNDGRTLVVENRLLRNDTASNSSIFKRSADTTDLFLLANGTDNMLLANSTDKLLLTETQTLSFTDADIWAQGDFQNNTGSSFYNYSKITVTPRVVDADATSVLWNMESSILVEAGSSVTGILATYRDPDNRTNRVNCIQGTTPVKNTDFKAYQNEDGTGTDLTGYMTVNVTFYPAEARIDIYNTGGTDFYTGGEDILFQLRGQGVKVYDTVNFLIENSGDVELGRRGLNLNLPYFSRAEAVKPIVLLGVLKNAATPRVQINRYPLIANRDAKNMMAFMFFEIGMRASFKETMTNYNPNGTAASWVQGYEFQIIGKETVTWSPCLFPDSLVPSV